jgi:hypothetical protein
LHDKLKAKGINYDTTPSRFLKSYKREYYIDKFNKLYSGRISKILFATGEQGNVVERISKYFDHLFIDEIQDFGGNDFNLLKEISKAKIGVVPDTNTLSKSYRCSPNVCKFITENLAILVESHRDDVTGVQYIDDIDKARQIFDDNSIVKLFYREHYKYDCFSRNWGDSKGEDKYYDICVVLNKSTLDKYSKGKLNELPPTTKNKLYVALSRAKNNLYLIPYNLIDGN